VTAEARVLGRTGIRLSPLCLGTWMLGPQGNNDRREAIRIVHGALDAGIDAVDTADIYGQGVTEEIVGEALRGRRDGVFLATKVHGQMGSPRHRRGNSRRWILQAVDESLRRLQTDWIDLYQLHRPDPDCDLDETLGALSDLVRVGKIRYAGTTTFPAESLVEAEWVAERRGHVRFAAEQPPYSMLVRGAEAHVLPTCRRYGLGVLAWSPLAGGWLTGRYRKGRHIPVSTRAEQLGARYDLALPENLAKLEATERFALLAESAGLSLVHLALAFVLEHPAVTCAIVGPRTLEHLESHVGAADVRLGSDVLDEIDRIVPPGVTLNPADAGWSPPDLEAGRRRGVARVTA
jgi:aryl-alcohol dehydrogenase-like predicted oxidoreductase